MRVWSFAALGLSWCLGPSAAHASNKYLEILPEEQTLSTPAYRYANLGDEQAFAEVELRGIPHVRVTPGVPGVRSPIRLTGPMHGVTVHSSLPEDKRKESPFEILDARLALAIDDFCKILAAHEIVELVHFTIYRPASSSASEANAPRTRHPGGLAIDVGALRKANGEWLTVGPHWSSAIGARTCGTGARTLENPAGSELRDIACEAAAQRVFTYMLTPHFDKAHHDHLHLEIKPGVKWFLVN